MVQGKVNRKQAHGHKGKTLASLLQPLTRNVYFVPSTLFLLCILLYGNTINNGYAGDDVIITNNSYILKGFSAIKDIFDKGSLYGWNKTIYIQQYRPLTLLCFMAENSLFGLNPHVSHLINVLLYAFTIVLLYLFLHKILKNYNPYIALAATLLFAFHPIHTEVVANVKSRDEILGFLFGLLSFYFIILHQEKKNKQYYFWSLAAFAVSIFCKENCLSFIAAIPLLLYFFTSLEIKKIIYKTIPFLGIVAIYFGIRSQVLSSMAFSGQIPVWDNALMAANNSWDRTATSFVLMGMYIWKTIIPYPLSYDYSYNQIPIVSWYNLKPVFALLVCLILIGYMVWGIRKKSIFSFLIALFFITLFLSSNLVIKIASTSENGFYTFLHSVFAWQCQLLQHPF